MAGMIPDAHPPTQKGHDSLIAEIARMKKTSRLSVNLISGVDLPHNGLKYMTSFKLLKRYRCDEIVIPYHPDTQ